MILSVLNQKGGVGKTTLAIHIATALVQLTGKRTLLIDADSQGALSPGLTFEKPSPS